MGDGREDEAANQPLLRDVNESLDMDRGALAKKGRAHVYVCECGDASCRDPINLYRHEYGAVRADGTTFAIALNHENPETDRVVVEYERYAVVQKTLAAAVKIVRHADPRALIVGDGGLGAPVDRGSR